MIPVYRGCFLSLSDWETVLNSVYTQSKLCCFWSLITAVWLTSAHWRNLSILRGKFRKTEVSIILNLHLTTSVWRTGHMHRSMYLFSSSQPKKLTKSATYKWDQVPAQSPEYNVCSSADHWRVHISTTCVISLSLVIYELTHVGIGPESFPNSGCSLRLHS